MLLIKAIDLKPRHVFGHQIRGAILCSMGQTGEAIQAFRNAYRLSRDVLTYESLVHCYISLEKTAEAVATAKEALSLFSNSPRAISLAGFVMANMPGQHAKAEDYLLKALKLDKTCMEAVYILAQLYAKTERAELGIHLLESHLPTEHSERIHITLGNMYLSEQDFKKAIQHFSSALWYNLTDIA